MSGLSKEGKLEIILETVKDHNITAYEIGKNTKISTFAVQKILKGETKKPNELTLNAILEFLQKAITATDYKEGIGNLILKEPQENYYADSKPKTLVEELQGRIIKLTDEQVNLMREISRLQIILEKNNIDY
jgi:predicted transcriptional regulator